MQTWMVQHNLSSCLTPVENNSCLGLAFLQNSKILNSLFFYFLPPLSPPLCFSLCCPSHPSTLSPFLMSWHSKKLVSPKIFFFFNTCILDSVVSEEVFPTTWWTKLIKTLEKPVPAFVGMNKNVPVGSCLYGQSLKDFGCSAVTPENSPGSSKLSQHSFETP